MREMYNILLTTLLVLSVIIVITVFLQPQKNSSNNVFDNSGLRVLSEHIKACDFEVFMQCFTAAPAFSWLAVALALAISPSKRTTTNGVKQWPMLAVHLEFCTRIRGLVTQLIFYYGVIKVLSTTYRNEVEYEGKVIELNLAGHLMSDFYQEHL